ncbi:metallophosphoesterase [Curtobacterium sp. MCJR17_043]|uniref:metallophosphoesterase n=1 Tax=Curtobacterium sp. MCJR17_043 TaxID=2175660 RepID=UPI0032E8C0F5
MTRARGALGVLAAGAALGVASAAWGSLVERRAYTLRWETVPVLPVGSRDVTVLHLSDIHMAPWQADKQQWIRDLSLVEPDFIVNTGDNLGHATANAAVEYALEPFRGIPGAFVYGSNDFFAPSPRNPAQYLAGPSTMRAHAEPAKLDVDRQTAFFESLGWLDLNDHARAVEIRGSRFELFGTSDAHRDWDRLDLLPANVDEMRSEVPWSEDESGPSPRLHRHHARALPSRPGRLRDTGRGHRLRRAHARRPGGRPGRRRARDELGPAAPVRERPAPVAEPHALVLVERLGRTRDLDLRARAVRRPAGGGRRHADGPDLTAPPVDRDAPG